MGRRIVAVPAVRGSRAVAGALSVTGDGLTEEEAVAYDAPRVPGAKGRARPQPRLTADRRRPVFTPEAGRTGFSASIAAEAANTTPYNHRDGFAAFGLCDPVNGWVYDLGTSGESAFAITERLPYPGATAPIRTPGRPDGHGVENRPGPGGEELSARVPPVTRRNSSFSASVDPAATV
ncbi:DUF6081 family protein [Streptomyces ferrugineus]|uniref:DUF6081 family protein n=1 Tax=Streptomyces ferrugineus TaxID=1413221 RepID=UPI00389A0063